tara:strand:- start:478 stop:840 length:363 start_codon:yes stop_codon:yes gene_type:complete
MGKQIMDDYFKIPRKNVKEMQELMLTQQYLTAHCIQENAPKYECNEWEEGPLGYLCELYTVLFQVISFLRGLEDYPSAPDDDEAVMIAEFEKQLFEVSMGQAKQLQLTLKKSYGIDFLVH